MSPHIVLNTDYNSVDVIFGAIPQRFIVHKLHASRDDLILLSVWRSTTTDQEFLFRLFKSMDELDVKFLVFKPSSNAYYWRLLIALRASTDDWNLIKRFMDVFEVLR